MTVRKTHEYSDSWEEFIDGILCADFELGRLSNLERLTGQLAWDQKIGMIVALSKDWTAAQTRNSRENRARQRAVAVAEIARMTRDNTALVHYLADEDRALLPAPRVRRRAPQVRRKATTAASNYFRRLDRARPDRIARIIDSDLRLSPQLWAARHPYGPMITVADLNRYYAARVRTSRIGRKKMAFNPAGMTPERALEIAARVLR